MTNAFADRYAAHVRLAVLLRLIEPPETDRRRLCLLLALAQAPGGGLTASLLHEAAGDVAPPPTRDQVMTDLGWLAEQGLVAYHTVRGVAAAILLARGREVVEGRAVVPGVAPLPSVPWVQDGLHAIALSVPRSDLDAYIDWLRGAGLIRVSDGSGALVALTAKGRDVAMGRDRADGVKDVSHETMMRLTATGARSALGA
jgi:hypothetical protein